MDKTGKLDSEAVPQPRRLSFDIYGCLCDFAAGNNCGLNKLNNNPKLNILLLLFVHQPLNNAEFPQPTYTLCFRCSDEVCVVPRVLDKYLTQNNRLSGIVPFVHSNPQSAAPQAFVEHAPEDRFRCCGECAAGEKRIRRDI